MIKHPIKQRLEELANGEVFRVVPLAMVYECEKDKADEILHFAKWFVDCIQQMCDVYERVPFEIMPHDEDVKMVKIRGRYAFSDTTVIEKPKRIPIDMAYYEIAYGGKATQLNGIYTLIELESIVEKLKMEDKND